MISFIRTSLSWLCVLAVLIIGPIQAHGLVLCIEKNGTQNIEFKTGEGDCTSCPTSKHGQPETSSEMLGGEECGCTDVQLLSAEQAYKEKAELKAPHMTAVVISIVSTFFSQALVPTAPKNFFSVSLHSGSSYHARTVVLLI
jgi:hypothetical protein